MNLQNKDLQEYIGLLLKWWWILLLGALLGAGTGYIMSRSEVPIYEAKVTLIIGNFVLQSRNPNTGELATSQTLAQSYAEIIKREPVLRSTVEALGINVNWISLKDKVSGRLVPNTQLFEVRVIDGDPLIAKRLANELVRQLVVQSPTNLNEEKQAQHDFVQAELAQLQEGIVALREQIRSQEAALDLEVTTEGIQQKQADIEFLRARSSALQNNYASLLAYSQENQVNQLTIIEPATIPTSPININNPQRRALQSGAIGLALALGIVFLIEYLDNTIKTTDDIEQLLSLPALSAIGYSEAVKAANYTVVNRGVFSPLAESYRILRTNLQFAHPELSLNTLLITSSLASEGKSITAINLAIVMAQADKQVILVDADLRRPMLHKAFKITNRFGLSTLLQNQGPALESVLAQRKVHNLRVLSSGPSPSNPTELLGSPQMEKLLAQLRDLADVVIIDSPPLLALTDARILSIQTDATILVIEAGRTQSRVCQRAKAMLAQVGVEPLGVVLNKFKPRRTIDEYHYSYYYSPYYSSSSKNSRNGHEREGRERTLSKF